MKIQRMTKELLTNVPDEIYDMFIEPINHDEETIFDSHPQGRWFFHFGGLSIEQFNNLTWNRTKITIDKSTLHPDSYLDINRIIIYISQNSIARTWRIPKDTPDRVSWHKSFVLKTGRIVAPVIGINTSCGIRILDGSHRLASLFILDKLNNIDIWLGSET